MNQKNDVLAPLSQVSDVILRPSGLSLEQIEQAFAPTAGHRYDDVDFYFQHTVSEGWSLEEGLVKAGSFSIEQGVGVRVVTGEKTAFAYSDDVSLRAIAQALKTTLAISQQGQNIQVALPGRQNSARLYGESNPTDVLSSAEKIELLHRLEQKARRLDARVVQVMAHLAAEYEHILIAKPGGWFAADVRPLVRISLQVILEQDGRREQGSSGGGGRWTYLGFDDALLDHYAAQAVHQAAILFEAMPAPAGPMTVVLGSGWPGILLHEAIGHGLEGDFNRKGTSAFAQAMGEKVAAANVTVVDDGTLAQRRGSLNVDDEGEATRCTTLIENGVLKGYLQDRMNGRLMGVGSTGNGRRESYAHLPMPRMTNTYMLAGEHAKEDIIASVADGLYAVNFGGGQVDITSGKFVFSASEAYLIKNGKIMHPVKGATLIGHGPDVLKHVAMVGNDLSLDPGVGVCGKDGQSVPVGVGQPTLRVDGGLTVGGVLG